MTTKAPEATVSMRVRARLLRGKNREGLMRLKSFTLDTSARLSSSMKRVIV